MDGALAFFGLLYGRDRDRFSIPARIAVLRLLGVVSIRTLALVLTAATAVATRLGEDVIAAHQVAWQLG